MRWLALLMGVTDMIRAPEAVKINEIIDETPTIKTFKFDTDIEANPGEFNGLECN